MPQKNISFPNFLIIVCLLVLPLKLYALGIPPTILHIEIEDYTSGEPLRIKTIITDDGTIDRCLLYFRTPDMVEFDYLPFYQEYEFYVVEIPPEFLTLGRIEYYIYVSDNEGNIRTSPEINPEINPYKYTLALPVKGKPSDILLLSPEPGSTLTSSPELIVISIFDPEDDVVPGSIKMKIDGIDVTDKAQITQDLVTYIPLKSFSKGVHTIELSAEDRTGNVTPMSFDFTMEEFKPQKVSVVKWNVNTSMESRYDKFEGKEQPSNRPLDQSKPRITANADWGWLKGEGELFYNFYIDEDARTQAEHRQTLNRYRLKLSTKPLDLIFGDSNPRFSELTIKGTRIRGINGALKLGFFGLSAFYGESRNKVEPYPIAEGDSVLVDSVTTPDDSVIYIYQSETGSPTYKRNAFGVRTAFSLLRDTNIFLRSAVLGFNYLRFTDDLSDSAKFSQDLTEIGGYDYIGYDSTQMESYLWSLNIDPLSPEADQYWQLWEDNNSAVVGKLGRPKDNIVFSSTLDIRLFKQTFLNFETALSILNDNQYGDRSNIDSLWVDKNEGKELSSSDQQLLDIDELMSDYFNFSVNDELIHTFTPRGYIKPVIFTELRTPLPFIPTNLRVNFRRIPGTFSSLGNPSIQTDINALKVDTRTGIWQNKVALSLGGETRHDNLYYSKQVTTYNNTLNTGLGLMFPKLPSLNISYRLISREGIGKTEIIDSTYFDPVQQDSIDVSHSEDSTFNKNLTSTITIAAGQQFRKGDWQANLNINGMLMAYNDEKDPDYNFDNNSYIVTLVLSFPLPVGIELSYGNSVNEPRNSNKTTYTILNSQLNYHWFDRKLNTYVGYDYLMGMKEADLDTAGNSLGNGIDNIKSSLIAGMKWKIASNMSLAMELELIKLTDRIEAENSYDENRAKIKYEYRF